MRPEILLQLAESCEQAQGPSWEMDCDICNAVYDDVRLMPPRAYSASLDAAMSLLDGVLVLISLSEIKGDGMPMCIVGNARDSRLFEAVAETMPLALCAASLRARARSA